MPTVLLVENIIFDWDGTLARTLELWLKGYQLSFSQRNMNFEPKEIVAEFFHNHHEVPEKYPDIDFPAIAKETLDYVHTSLKSVALYDGTLETLTILRDNNVASSLVSSSSRPLLEIGLGAHRLEDHFITTVAGDDGYGHKPHTRPFEEALIRMGVSASQTLVIGDSHVDIEAGKAIGCKTCLFAPPQNRQFHNYQQLKSMSADIEINHISELLRYT